MNITSNNYRKFLLFYIIFKNKFSQSNNPRMLFSLQVNHSNRFSWAEHIGLTFDTRKWNQEFSRGKLYAPHTKVKDPVLVFE